MTNKETDKIGLKESVAILVGGMIGSAIYSLSGLTMYSAGPAALLSWAIAGIIMLGYGVLVCELACRYPQSGGPYVFPRRAFGEKAGKTLGWLSCWCTALTNVVAIAFSAIYVGIFLGVTFPSANQYQTLLGIVFILLALIMNILRISVATKLNRIIVSFLILTLFMYISFALFGKEFQVANLTPFFTQGKDGFWGFISSIPVAIIGYSSINAMAFMVSDVKDPNKTLSKSMFIGISIVIAIYILVILSTLGLVQVADLESHPSYRFIPLFAATFKSLKNITWLPKVISVSAVIALFSTMSVCVSLNSRALQAASLDGLLPEFIGKTNKNNVPAVATIITCFIAAIIASFPKLTQTIVSFGALLNVFTICITILSLIFARRQQGHKDIIFTAPGGKVLPVLVLLILVACNCSSIIPGGISLWIYTFVAILSGLGIKALRKK